MTIIWHLFRKDLRHFRGRWAFWVGVLLLKTLLGFWLIHAPELPADPVGVATKVLIVLVTTEVALTLLLAALIMQDDPPLAGQAFWPTRPIAGGRLLLAKGLSLVLLLGLPTVVLAAPLWVACGAGASELAWMAAGQLGLQVFLVVPAAALGTLTRTPGGFLIGALVCLLGLPVVFVPSVAGGPAGLPGVRVFGFLFYLTLFLAMLPPAVAAYLERRPRRLIAIGLGSAAVAVGALVCAHRSLSAPAGTSGEDAWPEFRPDSAAGLGLEFAAFRAGQRRPGTAVESSVPVLSLRVAGRPADAAVHLRPVRQAFSWPDGSVPVRPWSPPWSSPLLPEGELTRSLGLPAGVPGRDEVSFVVNPGAEVIERLRGFPATYHLLAEVVLFRPELTRASLAGLSRWQTEGGRGHRLLGISERGARLTGVELLASEFLTPASEIWTALRHQLGDGSDQLGRVAFRSRGSGQRVSVLSREEGMVPILGVRFFRLNLIGDLDQVRSGGEDVDVVWLRWQKTASVKREVVAPDVRLASREER